MNASLISDYQLYSLMSNPKLASAIKGAVNDEWQRRKLAEVEVQAIEAMHRKRLFLYSDMGLTLYHKLLLLALPAFWIVLVWIIRKRREGNIQKKWKECWLYMCIGYLVWTLAVIVLARFQG